MREIKFRARNAEVPRCWIYGYFVKEWGCNYIINNDGKFKVIAGTECQYTGLKDSKGHEIYEGDIIGILLPAVKGTCWEIVWHDYCWQMLLHGRDDIHSYYVRAGEHLKNNEVTGNIYENPELLKEGR